MKVGAWFAGPPEELVAYLRSLEEKYPGLEYVHLSNSMGTPQSRDAGAARLARQGGHALVRGEVARPRSSSPGRARPAHAPQQRVT